MITKYGNEFPHRDCEYHKGVFTAYKYKITIPSRGWTLNEVTQGPLEWCEQNLGDFDEYDPTCRWNVYGEEITSETIFTATSALPIHKHDQDITFLFHNKDDAFLFKLMWG